MFISDSKSNERDNSFSGQITLFNNDSGYANGPETSMLQNETFVRLRDVKSITDITMIGRITHISNNKQSDNN